MIDDEKNTQDQIDAIRQIQQNKPTRAPRPVSAWPRPEGATLTLTDAQRDRIERLSTRRKR